MRYANRKPSDYRNNKTEKRARKIVREMADLATDLLFPPVCPFCERPWHRKATAAFSDLIRICRGVEPEQEKSGSGICPQCRARLPVIKEPFCLKCGKPVTDEAQEYCYDCSRQHHVFDQGRALYPHTGVMKRAVYELKYGHRRVYGAVFGREMAQRYAGWIRSRGIGLIVPVPLYRKRLRERGYNQAAEIAAELAAQLNPDTERDGLPEILYREDVLWRTEQTKRLKTLRPEERKMALKGVFSADLSDVGPSLRKSILVIDDIYTTGSTIDEIARTLKRAGAEHVYFLTVTIGQDF